MKEREDYISWDEYFMGVALLAAKRSKDPSRQVGACIVRDTKILSVGYNGLPVGLYDSQMYWGKAKDFDEKKDWRPHFLYKKELYDKHLFVVHAELNAILNSTTDLKGSTIYVDLFPCNECAKAIIQAGIKEVKYLSDEDIGKTSYTAAKYMLNSTGVETIRLEKTKFIENMMTL